MKTKTLGNMKTKQLGNSDLFITPVGFGAWAIGGAGWEFAWGEQDDKASIAAIHRALELGVNWIDTAAVYGMGHSEEVVARALKTWPGKRPYVFTKCALRWDERGQVRAFQENLRKHGVWVSEPVPMFAFPGTPDYLQRFGPPDDQAWERAHHHYINTFREKGYSDIQEQTPATIEDLECTF